MKDIGSRMKDNYELRARHYLTRRTPVIVRVDGRAFHTLTAKHEMLHSVEKNWTTDMPDRLRNGTFLYRDPWLKENPTILPTYAAISAIWDEVRPREEFKQERMNEPWQTQKST